MNIGDEKVPHVSQRDKIIDIAAMLAAAEVQNGNRTHYFYEWSDERLEKISKTSVKLATLIVKNTQHIK